MKRSLNTVEANTRAALGNRQFAAPTSRLVIGLALLFALLPPVLALQIELGTAGTLPGTDVQIPVTLTDLGPAPLSALAFFVTSDPQLGPPSVLPGPVQPNATSFVDPLAPGLYRVTILVLDGPSLAPGHVATLAYAVPLGIAPATYPLEFPAPAALSPPNPEARTLVQSDLVSGPALPGSVIVVAMVSAARVESISALPGNIFHLEFSGAPWFRYTVETSTDLSAWDPLTNILASPLGLFDLLDAPDPTDLARFYRVTYP